MSPISCTSNNLLIRNNNIQLNIVYSEDSLLSLNVFLFVQGFGARNQVLIP